jgi:hypothetical protein
MRLSWKHSSLLRTFAKYGLKKFYYIGLRMHINPPPQNVGRPKTSQSDEPIEGTEKVNQFGLTDTSILSTLVEYYDVNIIENI